MRRVLRGGDELTLKQEIEKIWSRVNEAMGNRDLPKANAEISCLITNIEPVIEPKKKKELDAFRRDLEVRYNKAIEVVNEETEGLKPLDRNQVRALRYGRLSVWRIEQIYKQLSELISGENLVPMG